MPRNYDGLFKAANSHFHRFKFKDTDGEWRTKSTGTKDRKEAQRIKQEFLQQLKSGQLPNELAKWTVERAVTEHLAYQAAVLRPGSMPAQRTAAKHLVNIIGANRPLDSLS